MKTAFISKVSVFATLGVATILVLIPFHAFLTVWAASLFGHYTALRLWKELLLVPLFFVAVWLVWRKPTFRHEVRQSWLLRLIAAYALLQVLLGILSVGRHDVNFAALAEGWIEDLRLVVFFFVAWAAAASSPWLREHWRRLVLIPAAVVVGFGLLQAFVLPANFLEHFGYSAATIRPYELVDQNSQFVRVQSTLRGANPLGAYLVVVIAAAVAVVTSRMRIRRGKVDGDFRPSFAALVFLSAGSVAVLYLTYSRSAYLGAALAILGLSWLGIKSAHVKRWLLIAVAAACVLFGGLAVLLRHNATFEDTFFHTSQLSHSAHSSNQDRTSSLEHGVHDVVHEPLGRGPGTAGPASEHNSHPARIAENYFLQIGQEVGWLGLLLFLAINGLVAKALWQRRDEQDRLAIVLLVSLVGLSFINLLSHAWADDTLAYIWWGLAGIALAPIMRSKVEQTHGKKAKHKAAS